MGCGVGKAEVSQSSDNARDWRLFVSIEILLDVIGSCRETHHVVHVALTTEHEPPVLASTRANLS